MRMNIRAFVVPGTLFAPGFNDLGPHSGAGPGGCVDNWRFYQGVRDEWRWYRIDSGGNVLAACDRGFAELKACMENAESVGFDKHVSFQVHGRAPEKVEP